MCERKTLVSVTMLFGILAPSPSARRGKKKKKKNTDLFIYYENVTSAKIFSITAMTPISH